MSSCYEMKRKQIYIPPRSPLLFFNVIYCLVLSHFVQHSLLPNTSTYDPHGYAHSGAKIQSNSEGENCRRKIKTPNRIEILKVTGVLLPISAKSEARNKYTHLLNPIHP